MDASDDDGAVNSSDSSRVLDEYALVATGGVSVMTEEHKSVADVNKDSGVGSSDYPYVATGGSGMIEEYLNS